MFLEDAGNELRQIVAAHHFLPAGHRQVSPPIFGNDYVEVAKKFLSRRPRQKFFDGKTSVVGGREKAAVVIQADNRMARVFPHPIKSGYLVEPAVERADIIAGVVAEVAEILRSLRVPCVNNLVAFGQSRQVGVLVRDDVDAKIFRRALLNQIPIAVDGGEFFCRLKGVRVADQKFFKRRIFSGKRQNCVGQVVCRKQGVNKIFGLAFGKQQHVVTMEAAFGD